MAASNPPRVLHTWVGRPSTTAGGIEILGGDVSQQWKPIFDRVGRLPLHFPNQHSFPLDHPSLCLVCIAESGLPSSSAGCFLSALQTSLCSDPQLLALLLARASPDDHLLHSLIASKISTVMMEQEPDKRSQKMSDLQNQVDQVKTIMARNVEGILERGERLENLEQRSEHLSASSEAFRTNARRVNRHMCRKNMKWTIIVGVGGTLVVILIVLIILKTANVI